MGRQKSRWRPSLADTADAATTRPAPSKIIRIEPPRPSPDADPGLRGRSVRGSTVTTLGFAVQNVLRLAGNLVVARLLAPDLFGIALLVNILMQGLLMLSDLGIGAAIVQKPEGEKETFLRTAFTLQAARGVALTLAAAAFAYPFATLYDEPRLVPLVLIAAFGLLASGLSSTALYRLPRRLMLGRLVVLELVTQVLGLAGMIVWAWYSPGVLALIVPPVLSMVLRAFLSHFLLTDRRDAFGWDRDAAGQLVTFSRWILVSTMLGFVTLQADRLIFGRLIPLDLLGVYGIAVMLATLPRELVLKVGQTVVFPALSRVEEGVGRFGDVVRRTRRPIGVVGGLLVAGLFSAGPPLVLAAYDDRYAAASWILPILAVGVWVEVLSVSNGAILLSRGRNKYLAAAQLTKVVSLVAGIFIGFRLGGFAGAVVGVALSELGAYVVGVLAIRPVGGSLFGTDALLTLLAATAAAAGWGAAVLTTRLLADAGVVGTPAQLAAFATASSVVCAVYALPALQTLKDVRGR